LAALKGEDETFDELLSRLVDERREQSRPGLVSGPTAMRPRRRGAARRELKQDVGRR